MFDLIDADENGSISKFEMFEAVKAETVASTRLTFPFVCGVGKCQKKTHGETSRVLLNFRCVKQRCGQQKPTKRQKNGGPKCGKKCPKTDNWVVVSNI